MKIPWLRWVYASLSNAASNTNSRPSAPGFDMHVSAHSSRGERNSSNEDAYLISEQAGLFAVADGMGGHNGGRTASHIAIDVLNKALIRPDISITGVRILQAIELANRTILAQAAEDPELNGMGCTLVATWIHGDTLHCFNIGDSRAYLWRDYHLQRITRDQTVGGQQSETAYGNSRKGALTQALGGQRQIQVDEYQSSLQQGDGILLVSDGITDVIPDFWISNVLSKRFRKASDITSVLVDIACQNAGDDDKTVVWAGLEALDSGYPQACSSMPECISE